MDNNHSRFILEENNDEFQFGKSKSNIDIKFNRVAFIFFVFFIISLIYSIHLVHLGSRKSDIKNDKVSKVTNLIKRSDIIDINGQVFEHIIEDSKRIKVPHERMALRNFVLFPLREICPKWVHPVTGKNIDKLIDELSDIDKKSILKVDYS